MFPALSKAGVAVVLAVAAASTASPASASAATATDPIQIVAGTSLPRLADSAPLSTGGPTIMSGSSTQSRGGLTCNNQWFKTAGQTNCTGNSSQRWRLHLSCQGQFDIYGDWQYGPGSDQNECNFRISSASIDWHS